VPAAGWHVPDAEENIQATFLVFVSNAPSVALRASWPPAIKWLLGFYAIATILVMAYEQDRLYQASSAMEDVMLFARILELIARLSPACGSG
jgi:hypothetical protein